MEKVSKFISEHQKEITIAVVVALAYRLGYSRGVKEYHVALCKALNKINQI